MRAGECCANERDAVIRGARHYAQAQSCGACCRLLPFVLVLVVWSAGWAIFHPNKATLPPVTDVVEVVWTRALDGELVKHILASLWRLFLGAAVGIITGIVGGFIAGLYRKVSEFLNPLVIFFNAISGIVWLPLMIGWLGIGTALAVFLIWNTVFFIVFQNTVLGVQLVPEVLEQGVQALGGGRFETIRSVILPGASLTSSPASARAWDSAGAR